MIASAKQDLETKFKDLYENLTGVKGVELKQNLSIEQVERYLGYFDIPNTGITLKEYQQRAVDKADRLFEENGRIKKGKWYHFPF